ncbi:MAG TPA: hypothetical protein VFZ61_24605 [Polyangiales bacterium]
MRSFMAWLGRKAACITASEGECLRGFALRALGPALGLLAACTAPHTLITARHTPCKPKQIEISHFTSSGFGEDWYASCGGQWYRCNTREQGHRLLYKCRRSDAPADAGTSAQLGAPEAGPVAAPSSAQDAGVAPPGTGAPDAAGPRAALWPDAAVTAPR